MENVASKQQEISLRELIQVLIDGKIVIAIITIAALILSALYSFVLASPRYESSAMLIVRFKDSIATPYGEFHIPYKTMVEYTSLVSSPETLQRTLSQMDSGFTLSQLKTALTSGTFKILMCLYSPPQLPARKMHMKLHILMLKAI